MTETSPAKDAGLRITSKKHGTFIVNLHPLATSGPVDLPAGESTIARFTAHEEGKYAVLFVKVIDNAA